MNGLSSAALQKSIATIIGELAGIGCKCHQPRSSAIWCASIIENAATRLGWRRREKSGEATKHPRGPFCNPPTRCQLRENRRSGLRPRRSGHPDIHVSGA